MSNFDKKFNKACQRAGFWYSLELHFEGFRNLLLQPASLTDEDRQALKHITAILRECRDTAMNLRKIHQHKLYELTKGVHYER